MKQDEIIEMARQVCDIDTDKRGRNTFLCDEFGLEAFAKLVAEHEREKYKWDIHSCSPTCNRYVCVAKREAVLAEREACAKVCEEQYEYYGHDHVFAKAIRARGQA